LVRSVPPPGLSGRSEGGRTHRVDGAGGAAGDNAAMESFFSLLQKNVLDQRTWKTRDELRFAMVTWIEQTYNRRRRQRGLGRLNAGRVRAGVRRSDPAGGIISQDRRQPKSGQDPSLQCRMGPGRTVSMGPATNRAIPTSTRPEAAGMAIEALAGHRSIASSPIGSSSEVLSGGFAPQRRSTPTRNRRSLRGSVDSTSHGAALVPGSAGGRIERGGGR